MISESEVDVLLAELRGLDRFDAPHVAGAVSRPLDGDWAGKLVRLIEQQRRALQAIEAMAGAGTKLRTYSRAGLGKEEFPV